MAEQKPTKIEAEQSPSTPAKKGLPIKAVAIVAAIMAGEGAAVFLVARSTSPSPASAETPVVIKDQVDQESTVEIPLVAEKFQNLQTGRVWIWDAEIVLKVKLKNQAVVEKAMESKKAEIVEGVSMIFRRAQHAQLKEPGLETVSRQLTAYLAGLFGKDADGHERLERIVIPKCRGFPAD
ncbi:MAG: hypothetical protein HBSAPP03_00520 [Phycisphaerae bacterium]|nr:MAG: hypothetical protein HBSAPP03_00520 [Phycisphaerae bacterium]